jgi:O-antigen/teichoic acid export membrane protein
LLAVADQGLFALSNFGLSVLLARWLSPRDYGAFSVTFTVLLLMGTVQTALLTEPMLVFGPARYRNRSATYVRRLCSLNLVLTAGMGTALLVGAGMLAWLRPAFEGTLTLAALAVASPAILLLWLMRRACYIDARPGVAASGGLAYALLLPLALLVVAELGLLTSASAILVVGAVSLPVAWWLWHRLVRSGALTPGPTSRSDVAHSHWSYGRWALATGVLSWVPANAVVLALPLWHSLDDAAILRVATTLVLPVLHVQGALAPLLIPALVRARDSDRLRSTATRTGLLFLGLGAAYVPIVVLLGEELVRLLFGPQYRLDSTTLLMLAALPLVAAVSGVAASLLRALERPDQVLLTYVAASAVTCLVGLPLVSAYSVHGALASVLLSSATTATLGTAACWRLTRGSAATPGPVGAAGDRTTGRAGPTEVPRRHRAAS